MSITLAKISPRIVEFLGADHVAHIMRMEHPAGFLAGRIRGCWDANQCESQAAYEALSDEISGTTTPRPFSWSSQWYAWFRGWTDVMGRGWAESDYAYLARIHKGGRVTEWKDERYRVYTSVAEEGRT